MSLTSALSIAQTALFNTSRQTSVLSRNVSEASNPDYARRSAVLSSTLAGARVAKIERAANEVLFRQNLFAISSWQGQKTLSDGLNSLQLTINGNDNATAPATAISKLQTALQLYASTPSNPTLAEGAIQAAHQVVRSLNDGAGAIQTFRADADRQIATAVDSLNRLLAEFEVVNTEVVNGTRSGRDVSDALDRRDALLKQISEYVAISTTTRSGNDMVIITGDGATLFETIARPVTFTPNTAYGPGTTGNAVYIDGVPLAPGIGGNTTASGSIAATLQLRDDVALRLQNQLDEVARGMIAAFAETDPSGTLADAAGLFTWAGGPSLPPDGTIVNGLAASIRVNAAMDPAAGGNAALLRDGGANGAAYARNAGGAASFSDLLLAYSQRLEEPMNFDPAAGLDTSRSVAAFAFDTVGWLESQRKQADSGSEGKEALVTRTAAALSNITGVNVDEEMALLLDLEHAYEASARIISVVDEMLATLLQATR
ncbi:flagellar hook-associated protein FlgK [Nitratireductor sp. ZSWI3]|uniref:flagellar hook-associated protein FlgK n=1 Tax=Nitratireductor sp. ZSWI3 TaxID=2966359 RepID=UPI00214F7933|nr:flagellar hook-associated protein FlgK [Nitratireductor sp. ZSWI3]MCR4264805.1 flagellar hook-associated protein FlgK [Nitratireductor sp. ZSWI3]